MSGESCRDGMMMQDHSSSQVSSQEVHPHKHGSALPTTSGRHMMKSDQEESPLFSGGLLRLREALLLSTCGSVWRVPNGGGRERVGSALGWLPAMLSLEREMP